MSKTKKQKAEEQREEDFTKKSDLVNGIHCPTKEEVAQAIHNLIVAEYLARAPKKTEEEKQQEPIKAKRGFNK